MHNPQKMRNVRGALVAVAICTAAAPSSVFAAKPYDAVVEYLDANATSGKTMYINTGLQPADNMGALVRFMPKQNSADSVLFGAKSSNGKNWYFGGLSTFYLSWNTNPAPGTRPALVTNLVYDVYLNYLNNRDRRIAGVGNDTDYSLAISDAWAGSGTIYPIWLFTFNNKGSPYDNGGYYRVFSARFTQGNSIAMELIPVRKDGVGYMFDKVTGTLLSNTKPSGAPDFVYGNDVADESYIEGTITLNEDANWTSRGILRLDSSAVIDLNGHSLTIAGAFGDGTIKDSSSGAPGTLRISSPLNMEEPFTATTSGNLTVLRSDKPYDAQVEYLEAPLSDNAVPYIDTGLKPADDLGVRLRVAPLSAATVCGALSTVTVNNKNVDWRWYMGFRGSPSGYLSWGTANPAQSFSYSANTTYDILFNHLNSRNRRVEEVVGTDSFDLPITEPWPAGANQNIYLFAYNNKGTVGNTGNARIYSAQFTQGGNVVMDLIPVRKNGEGYMYDKVSEKLLAKVETAPGAFTYVNDATDEAYIEGNITLDADTDWTSRGILSIDPSATIDLNGHSLTIAGVYGTGTITNSSETVGEVHFVVSKRMEQTSNIRLLGNLKVVKEGAGALSLSRAGQTFTGGVLIAEGKGYLTGQSFPETSSYWGANGGTITVVTNATFDVCGNNGFYTKNFVLNGGTLDCSVTISTDDGKYGIGNVTLVADSQFAVSVDSKTAIFSDPAGAAKIDLGGHTLTVQLGTGSQMRVPVPIENGTLNVVSGGYLYLDSGTSGGSESVNVDMSGAAFYAEGVLTVSNYTARYTQKWNHGAQPLIVYGTFTPAAVDANGKEYFHGCVMQDGSSIDLSGKTNAWSVVSTGWSGSGNADGSRTITFADNATVTVNLGTRNVKSLEKVIDWSSAMPENREGLTFYGVLNGRYINLKNQVDGVYVPHRGFMLIFR